MLKYHLNFGCLFQGFLWASVHVSTKTLRVYFSIFNLLFCLKFIACAAIVRSYVSGATSVDERTAVLTNISACQGLGFIMFVAKIIIKNNSKEINLILFKRTCFTSCISAFTLSRSM